MRKSRAMYSGKGVAAARLNRAEMDLRRNRPLAREIRLVALTAEIIAANFTDGLGDSDGDYASWAFANGDNGTDDYIGDGTGLFPRLMAVAGEEGGSDTNDHTHPIPHTHTIDHNHPNPTTSAESGHTHSTPAHAHSGTGLFARISATAAKFLFQHDAHAYTSTRSVTATGYARTSPDATADNDAVVVAGTTATDGSGTSGASTGHTHTVNIANYADDSGDSSAEDSEGASTTDNRPAFKGIVPLQWVG